MKWVTCIMIQAIILSAVFPVGAERERPAYPVVLPMEYEIFMHERELFGWDPDCMLNVPNFDSDNRVYIRSRNADRDSTGNVEMLVSKDWKQISFVDEIVAAYPDFRGFNRASGWWPARIIFDTDNHAYTLVSIFLGDNDPKSFMRNKGADNVLDPANRKNVLLYSKDRCRTWQVVEIPQIDCAATPLIEYPTGPLAIDGPPVIGLMEKISVHPARWADVHHFYVYAPRKTETGLELGEPITITRNSFGHGGHSGGGCFAARTGDHVHMVWGEMVLTEDEPKGSPMMGASLNLKTRELSAPVEFSRTFPANDIHNNPAICADSQGILHIMTGSHQRLFDYLYSLQPGTFSGGLSEPVHTVSTSYLQKKNYTKGGQTYVSLVCDHQDTLHLVNRDESHIPSHLGGQYHLNMVYQRKKKGAAWEKPKIVVRTPSPGYSCYYQKLALDRNGKLYLSYSYTNRTPPYNDIPLHNFRAMIASDNGGDDWHLVTTDDFKPPVCWTGWRRFLKRR